MKIGKWALSFRFSVIDTIKAKWERMVNAAVQCNGYRHSPKCPNCGAFPMLLNAGRKIGKDEWEPVCYACKAPPYPSS